MIHTNRLFDVPSFAIQDESRPVIAGGLGTGTFRFTDCGEFTGWRIEPAGPEDSSDVPFDRFHFWARRKDRVMARTLRASPERPFPSARLFPFTWTDLSAPDLPVTLESVRFSPLLPTPTLERSLPLHLVVFRAHNPTAESMETALMLTWASGWPDLVQDAVYDFQHDNLCLTGSLGSAGSPNRQGIAIPDLHYASIYQQGIEPWTVPGEEAGIVQEFEAEGELYPRVVRAAPHGAAAWVKFDLEPDETQEIPFVIAWHFPSYESGRAAGKARHYTQFLGRRRPDNAIVWLAEQAINHFGSETANYRHWMQQIEDWQTGLGERAPSVCRVVEALVEAGTVWTEEGEFSLADGAAGFSAAGIAAIESIWPDVGHVISMNKV